MSDILLHTHTIVKGVFVYVCVCAGVWQVEFPALTRTHRGLGPTLVCPLRMIALWKKALWIIEQGDLSDPLRQFRSFNAAWLCPK